MKVKELVGQLTEHIKINPDVAEHDLMILIYPSRNTIGRAPCVGVESLSMGFDWDRGVYFIHPNQKLQEKPEKSPKPRNTYKPSPKTPKKRKAGYCAMCEKPFKPRVDGGATEEICGCPWNRKNKINNVE